MASPNPRSTAGTALKRAGLKERTTYEMKRNNIGIPISMNNYEVGPKTRYDTPRSKALRK